MAIQLNKREKLAVWAAGIGLIVFIVAKLVVFPYLEALDKWGRQIDAKKVAMLEMQALKADYINFKQSNDLSHNKVKERGDFTLYSFLNSVSEKAQISRNSIAYMRPSTIEKKGSPFKVDVVEMKLSGVTLKQLMNYLHMVETSGNNVFVKRASISNSGKKKGFLDVTLLMETIA